MASKKLPETNLRADLLKLACLFAVLAAPVLVLWCAPGLTTPALISVASTLILSPMVNALERRGMSRTGAILVVFSVIAAVAGGGGYWVARSVGSEWDSLQVKAPA